MLLRKSVRLTDFITSCGDTSVVYVDWLGIALQPMKNGEQPVSASVAGDNAPAKRGENGRNYLE